ncbi:MAG: flavin reductase family protein [Lachnospiraceae bacterium]|nr:flavin reductase family protein [Lachnospiraceae bacterium]
MSKEVWKPGNMLYPLPAVMVSCVRPGGRPNIITVAWAGTICSSPAMISISIKPERYSYAIIRETGEFVVNLTTGKLARAADYCGVRSGRDVDKFQETRLTAAPAAHVAAPLIEESPVNIECRVRDVIELGSHHMFLSEVLGVDVDSRYLDDKGRLRLNDADLCVYSHGSYYSLGENIGSFGFSVRKRDIQRRDTQERGVQKRDAQKKNAQKRDVSEQDMQKRYALKRGVREQDTQKRYAQKKDVRERRK